MYKYLLMLLMIFIIFFNSYVKTIQDDHKENNKSKESNKNKDI